MDDKTVSKFNDLRRVCELWIRENKPELYEALQEVLGIKTQRFKPELYEVLRKAGEILKQKEGEVSDNRK